MHEKIIKNHKIRSLEPLNLKYHGSIHKLSIQVSIAFFKEALLDFKHEEFLSCIQALNQAIKYNPLEELFFSLKSFILGLILKKIEDALKEIEKALTLNPRSKNANNLRKTLLSLQSKKEFCSIYI